MGTIFVAYGGHDDRASVLEFAAERAAASGDDLYVYHITESPDEETAAIRDEVEGVLERVAPDVSFDLVLSRGTGGSDDANVSDLKRLTDAIFESDREFAYVVMGNAEKGAVEQFVVPSMTEAILETREIPVLLVPVGE